MALEGLNSMGFTPVNTRPGLHRLYPYTKFLEGSRYDELYYWGKNICLLNEDRKKI